jgi:hypothetical protein
MTETLLTMADAHSRIDALEAAILQSGTELVPMKLTHTFLPGLYVRRIDMPAGSVWTTKIHKVQHPFVILHGLVSVFMPGSESGVVTLTGPHTGITEPGTRRVLMVHEDTAWITYHALAHLNETLEEIEARIIEPHTIEIDGQHVDGHQLYLSQLAQQQLTPVEELQQLLPLEDYVGAP